jgi:hypothetical protein
MFHQTLGRALMASGKELSSIHPLRRDTRREGFKAVYLLQNVARMLFERLHPGAFRVYLHARFRRVEHSDEHKLNLR